MVLTDISMIHHVGIVLGLLSLLNAYNFCHPLAYFAALVYLYRVHERYDMRLRRKLRYEENKASNQRRILTDSETVRWLNHAIGKVWPICMEHITSGIFLRIIPWFLDKYKPWTVKQTVVQHLYLGRSPPLFTEIRVLRDSVDDDHLVLELGLNFLTADDMSAILYAKLRRRLGFGIMTKMHLTGMHVEGKVLVGVKFLRSWPFISRLRVCFAEPPYFQVTVKPIFNHGLDVTEVPGIAGWLDNLLAIAFEETLVQPNMLVVDMEKFVSPESENWFSVVVKEPVAHVHVEVIEGAEVKPSDLNGSADPYVKGHLGSYSFKTQIQKKTLTPKWQEEFKIPICSWDLQNVLTIVVRDKDHFVDSALGNCSVNINDLRGGQRHDLWLPLENVKMGRLHLAVTVVESNEKAREHKGDEKKTHENPDSLSSEMAEEGSISTASSKKSEKIAGTFEPIDVEGQKETGIWIHRPGSEACQAWEPRKGKSRHTDTQIFPVEATKLSRQSCVEATKVSSQSSLKSDSSSDDESKPGHRAKLGNKIQKGFHKILQKHPKKEDAWNGLGESCSSPRPNVKPIHVKEVGTNLGVGDGLSEPLSAKAAKVNFPETPSKYDVKGMAKSMFKNAGKSARSLKHVLSKKGSKRFSENPEGIPESEFSSGDESASSSAFAASSEGIPIASSLTSRSNIDDAESVEVLTNNVRKAAEDPTTKANLNRHKSNRTKPCTQSPSYVSEPDAYPTTRASLDRLKPNQPKPYPQSP